MKLVVGLALIALTCAATIDPVKQMQATFDQVDTNRDGLISRAEFDELYKTFDDNGDGTLDPREFFSHFIAGTGASVLKTTYIYSKVDIDSSNTISANEIYEVFKSYDQDGNNLVTFAEFSTVEANLEREMAAGSQILEKLRQKFDNDDTDNNGFLTSAEVRATFYATDTNRDNLISTNEFVTTWMRETGESVEDSRAVFSLFDRDNNGFYGNGNEREVAFSTFDDNDDNLISKDEFLGVFVYLGAKLPTNPANVVGF